MSTDTTQTENADYPEDITDTEATPQDDAQVQEEATEETEPDTEGNPSKEAAKYRRKLRDAETERDSLATQLESMQRQHVEAIAGRETLKPAAMWATTDLASLINEDGTVSAEAVAAAIRNAQETLGIQVGLYVPYEGYSPANPPVRRGKTNGITLSSRPFNGLNIVCGTADFIVTFMLHAL